MPMKDCKIRVSNREESEAVQRALFAKGYSWRTTGEHTTIKYTDAFGYTFRGTAIYRILSAEEFDECNLPEITVNQLLGGKMREQKPYAIVIYSEQIDPHHICYNDKELREFVRGLMQNSNVQKDSIRIYFISRIQKVSMSLKFRAVKS